MKKFLLLCVCVVAGLSASAQSTLLIKGVVIDQKECPLKNATVGTISGSYQTTVNTDGSFTLEVPTWTEYLVAKSYGMSGKKLKIDGGDMIFRMSPEAIKQWFVICNYPLYVDEEVALGGIIAGQLGNWGWYGNIGLTGYDGGSFWNLNAGAIKRITDSFHVYAGAGITEEDICFQAGIIGRVGNHFLLNLDCKAYDSFTICVGVGYAF